MLLSTYVLMPNPCSFVGRYKECGGSVWMRLNLFLSVFCTVRSMSLHSLYGGCAGSGLKLMRVFRSVLCTYAVACLDSVRFMIVWSLVLIALVSLSFVGVVSPSMLRIVPKCLEYGGCVVLCTGASSVCVWVFIVASTGHCLSKFQAKLLNSGIGVSVGALCMFT